MIRALFRTLFIFTGGLLVGLGIAYGSGMAYLTWREQEQPSALRVIQLPDGRQIPLVQPGTNARTADPVGRPPQTHTDDPSGRLPHAEGNASTAGDAPPVGVPPAMGENQPAPLLPPEQILLPTIATQWPVILGDNENIPQFNAVGWLLGSGFPGHPGNMVLFGHQGGSNPTFSRLHELLPGDEFSIFTRESVYRYRVRTTFETTPNDVGLLAPSDTPTATLITCAGPWDAVAQTNALRRVVVADLVR
jgi:sortase A